MCVSGALLVGAGVRVGVFIPVACFGHVVFVAFFAEGFACVEMVRRRYVAGVSDHWMMGNGRAEQLRQGGAWKQLSRGNGPSLAVLEN